MSRSGAAYVRARELVIDVRADYGAKGDGVTDDTSAITAAINAAGSSGIVYFPQVSSGKFYNVTAPLPLKSGVTYVGAGRAVTEIRATAGDLFAPTGAQNSIVISGLTLTASAGHLFNLGTGSNGLYQSTIRDCTLYSRSTTGSVVYGNGGVTWQEVYVENSILARMPNSTVPVVNLISSIGGLNGSIWQKLVINGSNVTAAPVWHVESSGAGSYIYDCAWRDICGEQNAGGLVHLWSPGDGCLIENVTDYDYNGTYSASLVRIDKSTNAGIPNNLKISGVGHRGGTINGSPAYHVEIATSSVGVVLDRIGAPGPGKSFIYPGPPGSRSPVILGPSGAAPSMRTLTASYALDATSDGITVFNGTNLTATLPDPTTVVYGSRLGVKNINTSALTVTTAGVSKTIDGAASQSLAQWSSATYVSDGTQWLSVT